MAVILFDRTIILAEQFKICGKLQLKNCVDWFESVILNATFFLKTLHTV